MRVFERSAIFWPIR